MVDLIGHATGNSVAFQFTAPRVVSRDFDGIRMDITYKDLELQTTLAKLLNVPLFLATICQQIYQMGRAAGLGDGAAIGHLRRKPRCCRGHGSRHRPRDRRARRRLSNSRSVKLRK